MKRMNKEVSETHSVLNDGKLRKMHKISDTPITTISRLCGLLMLNSIMRDSPLLYWNQFTLLTA